MYQEKSEYGRLAQLVEHSLDVRMVGDSSSSTSTNKPLKSGFQIVNNKIS